MQEPLRPTRQAHFSDHVLSGRRYRVSRWYADAQGASRPLLFFTGIGANIELLAPFLERLRGRDVITFDMPGVGGSSEYGRPYRLSAMADVAHQILTELGVRQVDVMGVSWGGMLAQEFAYRHQQSVGQLILAATSPGMPMIPGSLTTLWKIASSHRYQDGPAIRPYLQTLYGGSSDNLDTYAARIQAPSSTGYLHQVLAILGWTSARKLTRVRANTLILMGQDDRLVPPVNGRILKFLAGDARLEILKNAGHLFVLTHRDEVVRLTESFLDDSRPATTAVRAKARNLRWI